MATSTDINNKRLADLDYRADEDRFEMSLDAPISVCWQVSRKCNLTCPHCISDSGPEVDTDPEMDTEKCLEFVDMLGEAGVHRIDMTGGEPLLRDDIVDIVERVHEWGMGVVITSNGTVGPEKYVELAEYDVYFQISLDGTKELHERVRGEGTFERTLSTIETLQEKSVPYRVNHVIHSGNAHALEEFIDMLEDRGVENAMFVFFAPQGRGFENRDVFEMSSEEKDRIRRQLARETETRNLSIKFHDYEHNFRSCMLVNPDGTVVSQGNAEDECRDVDNILDVGIEEVWHSRDFDHLKHFLQYMRLLPAGSTNAAERDIDIESPQASVNND